MKFNIKETKVDPEGSLCGQCSNGLVFRDSTWNVTRYCKVLDRPITKVVESCTDFQDRSSLSLYELKQVAWILEVNKRSRKAGFRPPKDHGQRPDAFIDEEGEIDWRDDDSES